MDLKYIYQIATVLWFVVLFSSCLNNNQGVESGELSGNAQIYTINISSSKDADRVLTRTKFTIDQLENKIYNKETLPYLFSIDSIKLSITGNENYQFGKVVLYLKDKDTSYVWNQKDSVSFKRLAAIETQAANGKTTKKYEFTANIYQSDPYVLNWTGITENYLPVSTEEQKTVVFNSKFFSYIKSGSTVKVFTSSSEDGKTWVESSITGLPATIDFNSITAINDTGNAMVYAQNADKSIYKSTNGLNWSKVASGIQVEAIYGQLPTSSGEFKILAVVKESGVLKYASTKDLNSFITLNEVANNIPVKNFSSVSFENPEVFSTKYIITAGGTDSDGAAINNVFLLQERGGEIKVHDSKSLSFNILNSRIFAYDSNLYLLTTETAGNKFYISENYTVTWKAAGANQVLPEEFTTRTGASVITDSNNYIWIFGGKSTNNIQIKDVWRGRLNKFTL